MTSPTAPNPPEPPKPRKSRPFSAKDAALAEGLLLGMTLKAAAERAGVSYATAKRRRQDPAWNRRLMELEAEAVKQVVRRGVRSAEAALQILTNIAGNVKGPDNVGAAEHGERSRVQVYAASRLLSAFTQLHGRAVADADSDLDLATPTVEYVLVGIDTGALT